MRTKLALLAAAQIASMPSAGAQTVTVYGLPSASYGGVVSFGSGFTVNRLLSDGVQWWGW